MVNLLKRQTKANLLWQKRVRIITVLVVTSMFGLLIIFAALSPVAIYTAIVRNSLENNIKTIETVELGEQRQEITAELQADRLLLERASTIASKSNISEALQLSAGLISGIEGVKLRMLSADDNKEDGLYHIRISGVAAGRSNVVRVKEVFELAEILNVERFPIENLTPTNGEYLFSIELTVINKK